MKKELYFVEFESKYWHGASEQFCTVHAETEDEARYLAEPLMEAKLSSLGYENDPGYITKVARLAN
jgi:hypothetical protein